MEVTWRTSGTPSEGRADSGVDEGSPRGIIRTTSRLATPPPRDGRTREFLADLVNRRGKTQITIDDILFFNGLGDAIARCYSAIRVDAGHPSGATYSTHFLAEVLHASFPAQHVRMNPYHKWHPDMNELEMKVKNHKAIVGSLSSTRQPHGLRLPRGDAQADRPDRKENDLSSFRRDVHQHGLQRKVAVPLSDLVEDVPA